DLERIVERRVREQREFMRAYSSFSDVKYRPGLDYRRKRGLIADINARMIDIERESAALEELQRRQVGFPDGPIEGAPVEQETGAPAEDGGEAPPAGEGESAP
ncbi:MAG TPA: hypothetical protein VKZ63_17130, partial [Kofleriaceae bacterium]|nr:hypothetical protein [Kofleriaceae bacterium]